jgi:hypothetical protein
MPTIRQTFEQAQVIALLHAQYPQRTDILRALQLCSQGYWENDAYINFFPAVHLLHPYGETRIAETLILRDKEEGPIVVEIMPDGRIAGIKYSTRMIQ